VNEASPTVASLGAAVRARLPAAVALLLTLIAGLSWRSFTAGEVAKFGGDVLYATMIYAVVVLVRPWAGVVISATLALLFCAAVEFAQLTPWPAAASRHSALARLALGSTFHWSDLAAYLVGVLLGVLVRYGYRTAARWWRRELPAPFAPFS
jgi:hypothetical protein